MIEQLLIWVAAGLLGCTGLVIFLFLLADAFGAQADAEAAEDRQGPTPAPPRDITIGRDQVVLDRKARLQAMQGDTDVSRKARPTPPTHAERQRQASSHLSRGF